MTNLRKRVERLVCAWFQRELARPLTDELPDLTPEQAAAELAALLGVSVEELPIDPETMAKAKLIAQQADAANVAPLDSEPHFEYKSASAVSETQG